MPTNTEITASLVAGNVPPDRECVKNLSQILQGVQEFVSIQNSTPNSDPAGPDNSVAEQALNTANTALAGVQALQSEKKEVRTSGIISIPSGDSNFAFTFSPPMPSTDYDVQVCYYAGSAGFISAFYNYRVLESSIATNGFNLIFDNTPANTKVAIRVAQR